MSNNKKFITYFDFLGYKDFILKNDTNTVRRRIDRILIDIESTLANKNWQEPRGGKIYADLSKFPINCLNISDTILFWTNDDSIESFTEILRVTHEFNWKQNLHNIPIRGAMVYGDFGLLKGNQTNEMGSFYGVNIMYGKGLIYAHDKAESQSWAGTILDASVIEKLSDFAENLDDLISYYTVRYNVPFKDKHKNNIYSEEYAFRLVKGSLNPESFDNFKKGIEQAFSCDNKDISKPRVVELKQNTINFLEFFLKKQEESLYSKISIIKIIVDFTTDKINKLEEFFSDFIKKND